MTTGEKNSVRWFVALLVVVVAGVCYFPKVNGNIGWYNSGEFVAAALTSDVPHAPGYPLLMRLASFSIVSAAPADAAFRLNFLSVVIAIAALLMMYFLLLQAEIGHWPAFTAVILLLASRTFFDQAILFEVYCLEVFFIAAGMLIGLKIEKGGNGNSLAFLAGLIGALGVGHRPTFGLYALTLFFFVRQRSEPMAGLSWRWFFTGLGAGFLPSLDLFLQLQNPGRLLLDPQIGRGLAGFLRVFSGTVYSGGLFAFDTLELWQRFVFFMQFIFTDSSVLVLPAAVLALSINRGQNALKKALLVTAMVNLIFVLNYHAFEAHSMLLPCLFSLS
ncbi:MAG: DUF2723 domain-containing protein, partial [Candidatus Riflebacteria bacterium]